MQIACLWEFQHVCTMTLSIGLAYIYYLSTACTSQNTEHENATQAFDVCCATSAVKLSVLTTQFKWSIIIAREAINY